MSFPADPVKIKTSAGDFSVDRAAAVNGLSWTTMSPSLIEIAQERARQDEKWGQQDHPDGTGTAAMKIYADTARELTKARAENGTLTWADVLDEEYAEVLAEMDEGSLRGELIQTAAVALAWVEAIDRRRALKAVA